MIHSEVRWEVLGGFRWSDVTGPQEDRVVFVDESDKFIWQTIVLAQFEILADNLGVRLCGRDELPNIDVFGAVPGTYGCQFQPDLN